MPCITYAYCFPETEHSKLVLDTLNNLQGKLKAIDHMIQNVAGTSSQNVESPTWMVL